MDKIIKYDILTSDESDALPVLVNKGISEGWQPLGGVSVSLSESEDYQYIIFAQAMVKYAEPETMTEEEIPREHSIGFDRMIRLMEETDRNIADMVKRAEPLPVPDADVSYNASGYPEVEQDFSENVVYKIVGAVEYPEAVFAGNTVKAIKRAFSIVGIPDKGY